MIAPNTNNYRILKVNMLKPVIPTIETNRSEITFNCFGNEPEEGVVQVSTNTWAIISVSNSDYYNVTCTSKVDNVSTYKITPTVTNSTSVISDSITFSYTYKGNIVLTSVSVTTEALPQENMTVSSNNITIKDSTTEQILFTVNSIYPITVSTSDTSNYLGDINITNNTLIDLSRSTKTVTISLNTEYALDTTVTITVESGEGYLLETTAIIILLIVLFDGWYGVLFTGATTSTRIGELNCHKTLPILSKMRGCTIYI